MFYSHGPPEGILSGKYGCSQLLNKIQQIKPKLHIFGRINIFSFFFLFLSSSSNIFNDLIDVHSSYGITKGEGTLSNTIFVNASTSGENYQYAHSPIVIDL